MRVPGKAALAAMCVDESPVKSRWVPAESRTLFAPLGLSSVFAGLDSMVDSSSSPSLLVPFLLLFLPGVIRTFSLSVHEATSKPLSTAELGKELGLYDCNLSGTNVGAGLVRQTCQ